MVANPHVKEKANIALLIIDMINDFQFEKGEKLAPFALKAAKNLSRLKKKAKEYDIPVIYVNDNYGRWQSDFKELIEHTRTVNAYGKEIVQLLIPDKDDYFVLKPQFSAFFATPLDLLLDYLGVNTLIIGGVAGNMCIHFTANDAYMRNYQLFIPRDCTASNSIEENENALHIMEYVLQANVQATKDYDMNELISNAQKNKKKSLMQFHPKSKKNSHFWDGY